MTQPAPTDAAATATPTPGAVAYGVLTQTHPEYDEWRDVWAELDDFYRGGYVISKSGGKYLPRSVGETEERYAERCGSAAYINYLGQIIDYFVAALFSKDLAVAEASDAADPNTPGSKGDADFYSLFAKDADRRGTALSEILKATLRRSLLKGRWHVCADLPDATGPAPSSLGDEQKQGLLRAYVYEIPVEQIINWEIDDDSGRYNWCVINRRAARQASPFDVRGAITETFKVWTRDPDTKAIAWSLYSVTYPPDKPPKPDAPIPMTDAGIVSFSSIPIQTFTLPEALWVGNKIGPLGKEHYQRRTGLVSAEGKNLCAIAVYKAGAEVPAIGGDISFNGENPDRGEGFTTRAKQKGYVVTGGNDEIYYAEPAGGCYAIVDQQLSGLKDEMFRVVHQMAASISNNSMSLGRSGESKKQDRSAEAIVLGELGNQIRAFTKRIYDVVAAARAEDVVWVVSGLDTYDAEDRLSVVTEAVQMTQISIPSRTFEVEYKYSVADAMVSKLNPQTKLTMRQEICDGVDAAIKDREDAKKAAKSAALAASQPAAPVNPGGTPAAAAATTSP